MLNLGEMPMSEKTSNHHYNVVDDISDGLASSQKKFTQVDENLSS